MARSRNDRVNSQARRLLPIVYLLVALLVAFVVLPSALRPPPDPSTDSAALNPNAPPDNNPEQLIQSVHQAAGSGAGAGAPGPGSATTTTLAPLQAVPTTVTTLKPASTQCFGNPARQTPSVYSAPCAPAWSGDNGGATGKNVLPNELHIGLYHNFGAPPDGPVSDQPSPNEDASTRTMRVLMQYVNEHFQTYGRRIKFYGLPSGEGDPNTALAAAEKADTTYKLFAVSSLSTVFSADFNRRGLVAFTNPGDHSFYTQNRPGLFSWQMDLTQMDGMAAEYLCKTLKDRPAKFGGPDVKTSARKYAIVTGATSDPNSFVDAVTHECGVPITDAVQVTDDASSTTAIQRMRADGVTTIFLDAEITTVAEMMAAAKGYTPEWVLMGNFGVDFNNFGELLPKDQSAHLFGLSGWEIPQPPQFSECDRAYKSIDPNNDANADTCQVFWHPLMMMMDAIQTAGPHLTQAAFQDALFRLGHRYGQAQWSIGGGFGPDDYSYMDNLAEIWFDSSAVNPQTGAPGAYRWTHNGQRWKRGEFTGDDSQLFVSGITEPAPGS